MSSCNRVRIIYCEGETDKKLVTLLGVQGKIDVYNLVQKKAKSILRKLKKSCKYEIVIIFDEDVGEFDILIENIKLLKKQKNVIKVSLIQQSKNLEDEIARCSSQKDFYKLINSKSRNDFKRDFSQCNNANNLISKIDTNKLWKNTLNNDLAQYQPNQIFFEDLKK